MTPEEALGSARKNISRSIRRLFWGKITRDEVPVYWMVIVATQSAKGGRTLSAFSQDDIPDWVRRGIVADADENLSFDKADELAMADTEDGDDEAVGD